MQNIHEVDLTRAPGTDKDRAAALEAIFSDEGLVATGVNETVPDAGPAGAAIVLRASQYFRLVRPANEPL